MCKLYKLYYLQNHLRQTWQWQYSCYYSNPEVYGKYHR